MPITLTVPEAAASLKVRVDEVYRLIRSGRLKANKGFGRWAIDADSLANYKSTRRTRRVNGRG